MKGYTTERSTRKFKDHYGWKYRYRYVTDTGATGPWMKLKRDAASAGALNVALAKDRTDGTDLRIGRMLNEIGN